jgi:Lrp/AsnC family transcriptional regulator, leucine-responsive regulatory protein
LDEVDVQLVNLLQRDCKIPLARLGEQVGLSAPSVMDRVRKLEKTGVILGYHAVIDARKVGLDVTAFIGISLNYAREGEAFERAIEALPEILEVHHVTGGVSLLLKVKVENTLALERIISHLRLFEGVQRTETMVVLSTSRERTSIHLPDGQAAEKRRRPARKGAAS